MANDYTTSTDAFADISEGSYSSSDYPQMASFVTVASRLIDAHFARHPGFFSPSSDDETRYYDGSADIEQPIGEWAEITSVAMSQDGGISSSDYTALTANTDYFTKPYNRGANSERPINTLVLNPINDGAFAAWYPYRKAIKIVGRPGYCTTVPDLVAQAAKVQSIRWFMASKQGYSEVGADARAGGLTFVKPTKLDSVVLDILWPLYLELS